MIINLMYFMTSIFCSYIQRTRSREFYPCHWIEKLILNCLTQKWVRMEAFIYTSV